MDTAVQPRSDVAASEALPARPAAADPCELEEIIMTTLTNRGIGVGDLFESTYPADADGKRVFGSVLKFRAELVQSLLDDLLKRLGVPATLKAAKLNHEERMALYDRLLDLRKQAGVTLKEMIRIRTIDNRTVAIHWLKESSLKHYALRYENYRSCSRDACMYANVVTALYAAFAVAFRRYEAEHGTLPE
ncbi:MAG TPA: hypothetical protein VLF59_03575 [Candidatus Saccharimonadales bacterium]|nr:hypothetical protein [Candidatus Saccharimonadales bacterium]